jgi:hypothetical protein
VHRSRARPAPCTAWLGCAHTPSACASALDCVASEPHRSGIGVWSSRTAARVAVPHNSRGFHKHCIALSFVSTIELAFGRGQLAMCNECVKEVAPDRGTTCHEGGCYFINLKGCKECGKMDGGCTLQSPCLIKHTRPLVPSCDATQRSCARAPHVEHPHFHSVKLHEVRSFEGPVHCSGMHMPLLHTDVGARA